MGQFVKPLKHQNLQELVFYFIPSNLTLCVIFDAFPFRFRAWIINKEICSAFFCYRTREDLLQLLIKISKYHQKCKTHDVFSLFVNKKCHFS